MMKKVTLEQMKQILLNEVSFTGSTFVGFDSLTEVKLKGGKKNPMQGRVQKVREGALCIALSNKNTNSFENMVNKRLANEGKEANFQVGLRAWGERLKGMPLVMHNGELYLEVIEAQKVSDLESVAKEMGFEVSSEDAEVLNKYVAYHSIKRSAIKYLLDGEEIAKDKIEGLETKQEGEQGGLSDASKVIIRTYKVASLTRLTIGGVTYIIE